MKLKSLLAALLLPFLLKSQSNCWTASLHEGNIHAMVERGGSVWVGTDFGLVEIEKSSRQILHRFGRQNSPLDGPVNSISLTDDNKILVGTEKLRLFDGGSDWQLLFDAGMAIRCILTDSSRTWLGTTGGIFRLEPGQPDKLFAKSNTAALNSNIINTLKKDANGVIWAGIGQPFSVGGLVKIPKTGLWKIFTSPAAPLPQPTAVRSILIDFQQKIWLAVADQILRFDPDSTGAAAWQSFDPTPNGGDFYTFSLAKKTTGELVVGMEKSVATLGASLSWSSQPTIGLFSANTYIFNVLCDAENRIWAGSNINGLTEIEPNGQTNLVETNLKSLPLSPVLALAQSSDGTVFAGTSFGGILKLDATGWTNNPQNFAEQSAIQTLDFQFEPTGEPILVKSNLWQNFSVQRWNGAVFNEIFNDFSQFGGKRRLRRVGDALYVSCTRGLFQWKNNALTHFDTSNSSIPTNFLYDMETDAAGNIWLATASKGLVKFDGAFFSRYDSAGFGLPTDSLIAVTVAKDQSVWFSDAKGHLLHLTDAGFESFKDPTPPADNRISTLEADPNGAIWLNNQRGATRFDPSGGGKWLDFTSTNSSIEPTEGPVRCILPTTDFVWLGMNFGIYRLDQTCLPLVGTTENEAAENRAISVFPNPTSDATTVSFSIEKQSEIVLKIRNFNGQIASEPIRKMAFSGENQVEISTSNLPTGIYFLEIEIEGQPLSPLKLVKVF